MWIDKGIDTGNTLTTELTKFNGNKNLLELHIKVMEHARNLYIDVVKPLHEGKKQSIKQSDIAKGTTFYTKQWALKQKISVVKNFSQLKKQYDNGSIAAKRKYVKTFTIK